MGNAHLVICDNEMNDGLNKCVVSVHWTLRQAGLRSELILRILSYLPFVNLGSLHIVGKMLRDQMLPKVTATCGRAIARWVFCAEGCFVRIKEVRRMR